MRRVVALLLAGVAFESQANAETIAWDGRSFEMVNVKVAIVTLQGEQVLKVERDLQSLPFDLSREVETVDDRQGTAREGRWQL